MKRMHSAVCLLAVCLLTGCTNADAHGQEPVASAAALPSETQAETTTAISSAPETTAPVTAAETVSSVTTSSAVTQTPTEQATEPETEPEPAPEPETQPVFDAVLIEPEPEYETFTGILIDADCSDFEDPPSHDLPCMLMDTCRASGYGLDIQSEDGTWYFIPFDENGQNLTLNYLLHTTRMDHLYAKVTGTLTDGVIAVQTLTEIE